MTESKRGRQSRTSLESLEFLYNDIMHLLDKKFSVSADSTKLYRLVNELPREHANFIRLRWAPELGSVMEQFILLGEEHAQVELSYSLMRKNRPALYQELVIQITHPDTPEDIRSIFVEYCEKLRELNDGFNGALHAAFEEHSAVWWDEMDESLLQFGEYDCYVDAIQLAFNEAYVNFDILEQVLAAIRRVIR
ncbi:hypothetical protein CF95_gp053 [Erwinia phage PhiEaH1]|uniref:Uncharacterized protein n=1 Tax=Erwinia phage PhiEaH1 TaxID=1401669 RepID=W8CZW6_9CAUD|nr:hypothetical protein CF95_gp053 [Erwinia phage PhiEaH1]AGX01775.1 hypothetical protein [Erwinia phage PhiEaH1]